MTGTRVPVFEVWVDDARFVMAFTYPEKIGSEKLPAVPAGYYRFASHCFFRLGVLPGLPFAWAENYIAARYSAGVVRREFPQAHVVKLDGEKRRMLRWR